MKAVPKRDITSFFLFACNSLHGEWECGESREKVM